MKNLLFIVLAAIALAGNAQSTSVNDYKDVIVPMKYDFQKEANQYRINTLVKMLLSDEGFEAYYEGQQPEALKTSPCEALRAEVLDASNLFTTGVVFALKDCYGNTLFESERAVSKIKDYEASYQQAIRKAFEEVTALEYAYEPSAKNPVAATPVAPVQPEANIPAQEGVVAAAAVAVEEKTADTTTVQASELTDIPVLYAQPLGDGYQLVDTTPALRFKIRKTSREDTYTIIGGDGLLYRQDNGTWVAEYYLDGNLIKEVFQIKF